MPPSKSQEPETPAISTRRVALIVGGAFVAVAVVAFGFTRLFPDRIGIMNVPSRAFPAPGVRPDERAERYAIESAQKKDLAGDHGRMPIDQAMRAIAGRGAQAFDPVTP